jgi:hypothetical protein
MDLLSSINLPHWLMIAGAILVVMGVLGLVFGRNKKAATNPDSETPAGGPRMPSVPRRLDSSLLNGN